MLKKKSPSVLLTLVSNLDGNGDLVLLFTELNQICIIILIVISSTVVCHKIGFEDVYCACLILSNNQ